MNAKFAFTLNTTNCIHHECKHYSIIHECKVCIHPEYKHCIHYEFKDHIQCIMNATIAFTMNARMAFTMNEEKKRQIVHWITLVLKFLEPINWHYIATHTWQSNEWILQYLEGTLISGGSSCSSPGTGQRGLISIWYPTEHSWR